MRLLFPRVERLVTQERQVGTSLASLVQCQLTTLFSAVDARMRKAEAMRCPVIFLPDRAAVEESLKGEWIRCRTYCRTSSRRSTVARPCSQSCYLGLLLMQKVEK